MVRYILPDSALCFVSVLLLLGASSCSQNTEPRSLAAEPHPGATDSLDKVQVDERVLATVNGSRIGEQDLTINLIRTLGDAYPQFS